MPTAASAEDLFDNAASRSRYEAFSRLQAAAVAFGENLPIPEIVAVGGQSDGKSSLLEALLGFRFNIREVEIGTRRPLIVQMTHDPSLLEPRCRLQNENDDDYGPPIVPETAIATAIQKRTEEHLRQLGNVSVSSKPIIMRTEYAFCPNLTIIDTPGLILQANSEEADSTPDDILTMIKEHAMPSNRLILFLQQSSVEWASSLWMHVIQEVDPQLQRTVFVCSKFDNRLKEFQHKWEVDKYLSATGYLPPQLKPFFVALPKASCPTIYTEECEAAVQDRRVSSSSEWRTDIQEVDSWVLEFLKTKVNGGFDEKRYGSRVGFGHLKKFLEAELARRYRDAAPSTLAVLNERCSIVKADLEETQTQLASMQDVQQLRKNAMLYTASVSTNIGVLLDGASDPDPEQFGLTTQEELTQAGCPQWPGVHDAVPVSHASLRLYGGAAFERCMEEFQNASNAMHFPSVAQAKLSNILLAHRGRTRFGGGAQAAEEIARATAREYLGPLLDTACARLALVLHQLFDIALERVRTTEAAAEAIRPFVAFNATLKNAYSSFVRGLERQAKSLVRHHLAAATSEFASLTPEPLFHDPRNPSLERKPSSLLDDDRSFSEGKTPRTPQSPRISIKAHSTNRGLNPLFDGGMGGASHEDISHYAENIFQRIRHLLVEKVVPTTLRSSFLDPIQTHMAVDTSIDIFSRSDPEFLSLFLVSSAVRELEEKRALLSKRATGLEKCKREFEELSLLL